MTMSNSFVSPSELDDSVQSLHSTTNLVMKLNTLLTSICSKTEWEYGESWLPNATYPILELSSAWCIATDLEMGRAVSWMQFQVCSKAFALCVGEGMPGRVWQSQQPEWIDDVSAQSETYFLRNQIARALTVKAGFGILIIINSQLLAVTVFFMSTARSPDTLLMEQTQAIVSNFQDEFLSRTHG